MNTVFLMIAKLDLPSFDKGDVITAQETGGDFGANVKNNNKFHVVEVTNMSVQDIEPFLLPLTTYVDNPDLQQDVKARKLFVTVDSLLDKSQVTREYFTSLAVQKELNEAQQASDVVVN